MSEEEEFVIQDMVENEESEQSENFSMNDMDPEFRENGANQGYPSRSPMVQEDSIEEIIENGTLEKELTQQIVLPSGNRTITDDITSGVQILTSGHYSSINPEEDYKFTQNMEGKGYKIDIEEAQKMMHQDKSGLDCGLCKKKGGEASLIGPFKYFINDQATDEMTYWFHRECLERNNIVVQKSRYEFENIQE